MFHVLPLPTVHLPVQMLMNVKVTCVTQMRHARILLDHIHASVTRASVVMAPTAKVTVDFWVIAVFLSPCYVQCMVQARDKFTRKAGELVRYGC